MGSSFFTSARTQFLYYKSLGDKTLAQLTDEQLHWSPGPESNSIATVVKHMSGNMRSRWVDFLETDGEKPSRKREEEFTADLSSRDVILMRWERGWAAVFTALDDCDALGDEAAERIVYIRAKGHTVTEAVNRQLCHYAYHVGQMTFLGKLMLGEAWTALSIPKGGTAAYNQASFAKGQRREHFSEAWLPDQSSEQAKKA